MVMFASYLKFDAAVSPWTETTVWPSGLHTLYDSLSEHSHARSLQINYIEFNVQQMQKYHY